MKNNEQVLRTERSEAEREGSDGIPEALALGLSGVAVMSVYVHGPILAISTEGGGSVHRDAAARNIVEELGRPSFAMSIYGDSAPSEEYAFGSEDGAIEFGEYLRFSMVRADVLSHMAGAVATHMFRHGRDDDLSLSEESSRFMDELALIDGTPDQLLELRSEWLREATDFVRDNWTAVERVARALIERRTLEDDAVAELSGLDPDVTYHHR